MDSVKTGHIEAEHEAMTLLSTSTYTNYVSTIIPVWMLEKIT